MADLCSVLNIKDPTQLNTDELWSASRGQGPAWMRFPIGLYSDTEELVELDLRSGFEGGIGIHGLVVGTTGAGKTSGVLTEVMAACLTHSPEDLNVVYAACTQHSVADELSQFPHVVAVASNLAEDAHQLDRLCDALSRELDRRGEMVAVLDGCPDVSDYNRRRREGTPLAPIPVLWVIVEDYDAAFADPERDKLRDLFRRIARVGRSLHVYFQLVGQTRDTQSLQGITNMLGYAIAARTATPEDSRIAIGDTAAALIDPEEQPGTAYLRTSFADPDLGRRTANLRKFRYFWATDNNPIEMASTIASALRAATQNPPPPL